MSKKPAKRRPTKPVTSTAETAARAERDRLRRLETLHRNLRALGRNVSRYARGWEIERAVTARALLEGSAWGVFERDLITRLQAEADHYLETIRMMRGEIDHLHATRETVTT
jgi:hypothetical protein